MVELGLITYYALANAVPMTTTESFAVITVGVIIAAVIALILKSRGEKVKVSGKLGEKLNWYYTGQGQVAVFIAVIVIIVVLYIVLRITPGT